MTAALWVVAALWTLLLVRDLAGVLAARSLPAAAGGSPPPRVTAVVAARDEAARIAGNVRTLLAQTGVDLEVIAVDDRSRDGTAAELAALRDPRLHVLRVETLPSGWLGKAHAHHLGASRAAGDWLLFLDADTRFLADDALARAVALAGREGAAHVCLLPRHVGATFLGSACALMFQARLAPRFAAVNRDGRGAFAGIGVFNLVAAATWRAFGGHQALRLEVVDDMNLGRLVRGAGGRTRACFAPDAVATEWSASARAFVANLEKNLFAAFGYSTPLALLAIALFAGAWVLAAAGPLAGGAAGTAAGAALLAQALPAAALAPRIRAPRAAALAVPFLLVLFPVALARSLILTLARGGVRWRDTFHPLAELRAGRVRRQS